MKLAIFGLLFFGVVAATCAAVLVASLQVSARPSSKKGKIQFLVASQDLPRGKILDPDSITEKVLDPKDIPEGVFANPVQVIGKVLNAPMVEGQPFTKLCFASGPGYRVAAFIAEGMRAVTLSLTDSAALYGILYPGCTVDVLSTFSLPTSPL